MSVVTLVFVITAGLATTVNSFPSSDLAFPAENGVKTSPVGQGRFQGSNPENRGTHKLYPPLGYHRPDYFGHPGSRPGADYKPTSSRPQQDYIPLFSRPGESYNPQESRPNGNSQTKGSQGPGQYSRPTQSPGDRSRPRPIGNSIPQALGQESRPSFTRPGENSRPQNSKPSRDDDYTRPGGDNPGDAKNPYSFQPDFLAFGSSAEPPNENSASSEMSSFLSSGAQAIDGSTPSVTAETTTKIPRRDPTYRIVYTSPCPCSYTRQYEPVCGTDGQTYGNIGVLQCAQTCGSGVKVFLTGSCGRNNGHTGAISLKY